MKSFRLDGRRALVTGGSRGMGLAIARAYAEAGADVVIAARKADELEAAAHGLREFGRTVGTEVIDLSEVERIESRYAGMVDRHGAFDILVNSAAVSGRGLAVEMPLAAFEAVLRLDLSAAFAISQAFARGCIERAAPGRIVNIASIASFTAVPTPSTAYASAKAGVLLLTKQMAYELARHDILVNAIAPGYIETEMSRPFRDNAQYERWRENRVPMRRWGRPDEVAGAALLLASPAGSFITGTSITVDGGLTSSL